MKTKQPIRKNQVCVCSYMYMKIHVSSMLAKGTNKQEATTASLSMFNSCTCMHACNDYYVKVTSEFMNN